MNAIILAGGSSRRLGNLTEDKQKCLLDVGGKPILGRQLEQLHEFGIKKIYIAVGFHKDKIIHYCQSQFSHLDINYVDIPNWYETNNAKGFEQVLKKMQATHNIDDIILLNADVVCYKDLIKELINSDLCENLLAYQKKKSLPEEDMKIIVDGNGKVLDIAKTIPAEIATGEFTGIAKFSAATIPALIKYMEMCKPNDWFEKGIKFFIENEETLPLYGINLSHYPYIEIDFIQDYELANDIFPYDQPVWEQGGLHEFLKKDKRNLNDALGIITEFRDVLNKHGVTYWLNWGLLLGAVKFGHPIKWDTDCDLTIHKRDEEKLWNVVVPEMRQRGFFVPDRNLHCDNDCFLIKDYERIECNTVEKVGDKYVYSPQRCKLSCPAHYIDTLTTMTMMGEEFSVPSNTGEYLRGWYGNWEGPPRGNGKPISF